MTEAYIIDAVRTPVGKRGGGLAQVHPADMAAHVIKTVVGRHEIDPDAIDDVILGCLDNIGSQAGDIARTAALAAGLPESVPGVTIDRQCGSAQQAVHFAAQAVMSGTSDLIVAGGVQKMSQFPILSAFGAGEPYGSVDPWTGCQGWAARYGDQEISQFRGAEMIAEQWKLSREDNERFAYESHQRALAAIAEGRFSREITEYAGVSVDEGPRADTTLEKMAGLKTLVDGGVLTAAVASQISDGAAALLVASKAAVDRFGLTPRARVHHISVRGADPVMMLTAPIPATQHALKRAGLSIDDIDTVEINEAFAPVVLAWLAELGADPKKVNPNGGAIALGHPIGCTGARLMTSMLHELERTGGRYGLQTMCEGGGQANVTIIERL
ncbi:acetyl-CoA C-acetyltransferase [Mycolicibacterium obuense]|uniref:3-oxoadipyl-CoA/3-oxo-5,6-dehydrosuberyl-CoA thiolase n=1 Tax=Mycolicibacterium obuense TaxID=1807 RepID=A0A0J6W1L4_9MYCO|nr:acetyl-CoA C-acetyltransferase [Mycolicibacterium obuense]KKF03538.1 acetyl-CoA acetyltransferase [Mycolicibacterium obuense]KMO76294.1 3-oxoadipyl-CoA/3-oxo-5,6-dehydrosuberyl-CoA thiolase [Mycolicibacterium obuense]OKH72000.1 acetyl-CoA acetyltransferase [Mycobacterium sp. SWH-M1]